MTIGCTIAWLERKINKSTLFFLVNVSCLTLKFPKRSLNVILVKVRIKFSREIFDIS